MADNLKMASYGTQFSDATVSIAWAEGREASEVVAVPPASRSSKLLDAISAGFVVETNDAVTVVPDPPEPTTFVRVTGTPEEGQAPVWDEDAQAWVPAEAGTAIEGVDDVPGLTAALAAKATQSEAEQLAAETISALFTNPGDILYLPSNLNYATAAMGATAFSVDGGNDGSPANLIDGNDTTYFNSFNFNADRIRIDLGQVRAIAGMRLVQGNSRDITVEYADSDAGPWTVLLNRYPSGGGTPQVTVTTWDTVFKRHWRFTPYDAGNLNYVNWRTIELHAANSPTRLAAGTNGQVLTIVNGVPAWADPV